MNDERLTSEEREAVDLLRAHAPEAPVVLARLNDLSTVSCPNTFKTFIMATVGGIAGVGSVAAFDNLKRRASAGEPPQTQTG